MTASMIDQYSPHDLSSDPEKMGPALPINRALFD
jgi:hypothetical protein